MLDYNHSIASYFEHYLVSYHTAKAIGKNIIILSGEDNKTKAYTYIEI